MNRFKKAPVWLKLLTPCVIAPIVLWYLFRETSLPVALAIQLIYLLIFERLYDIHTD